MPSPLLLIQNFSAVKYLTAINFPEEKNMSFPLAYSEDLLPKPIIKILVLIRFLHRLISTSFNAIGLGKILDFPNPPAHPDQPDHSNFRSISSTLIKQILPSIRFEDLLHENWLISDGCAVCLKEFETSEEIRPLSNCRHVFHQCCLDRWIELDEKTCPLCRKLLVPKEIFEAGFYDFGDDFLPVGSVSALSFSTSALPLSAISVREIC